MATVGSRPQPLPKGFEDVLSFPLFAAIFGRRARRFSMGATIPDGPLAFESKHEPMPLSELEQMLVLTAAGGNTGWHYAITRNATYAPHLANYATRMVRSRSPRSWMHTELGSRSSTTAG